TGVRIVAKRDHPQTVDDHVGVIGIFQERYEFAREAVERGYFPAAKISHEDGIAVLTEIARSPDNAPRRIHPRAVLEMADESARRREVKDEAEAVPGHIIVSCGVLLRIGNEQSPANVLNVEGCKAVGNSLSFECIVTQTNTHEIRVVDFDTARAEICHVE